MERRRTPIDRMVDLVVAAPVCTLDAARRLAPAVGRAVRSRLATDPPDDHLRAEIGADDSATVPEAVDDPSDAPGRRDGAADAPVPVLAIEDYDNLAARQVVDRLDGLDAAELAAIADHERAHRHRQTVLRRIEQLLP